MRIDKRNLATSDAYFVANTAAAWTDWKVTDAVKDGYRANPWVYRAVRLIAQSASTVPWVVYDAEMSPQWEHPLSLMFRKPNPHLTRQQVFEMVVAWLELAGNSYFKKVIVGGRTVELWPVSPDRLAPIPSKDPARFIDGYMRLSDSGSQVRDAEYNADTVIHIRFIDPANPYLGIGPLAAAAKSVDLDNAQLEWNTATMQNRAVVDGVFTFKRTLERPIADSIMERITEKLGGKRNARKPLVIGDDAQYTRLALSPAELDFLESRKNNCNEILAVYGVPPQLVGIQESSTYNNFSTSRRVFWETTILPLLDTMRDAFNHTFASELQPGLTIGYDTTNIVALKDDEAAKATIGKTLHSMGIPVSIINEKLELGITEYPGWDAPPKAKAAKKAPPGDEDEPEDGDPDKPQDEPEDDLEDDLEDDEPDEKQKPKAKGRRSFELVPLEQRSVDVEIALRDTLTEKYAAPLFAEVLAAQRRAVFELIEKGDNPGAELTKFDEAWDTAIRDVYEHVGVKMGAALVRPRRRSAASREVRNEPYTEALLRVIRRALQDETLVLIERSQIQEATAQIIAEQAAYAVANGWSPVQLQQAIADAGAFSPERALRIARTTAGAATGVGQIAAGTASGATRKTWLTSGGPVRPQHAARSGETVEIDARFSAQFGGSGPRYPCDSSTAAADRINCRCFLSFHSD